MHMSIGRVSLGLVVLGLATACGGKRLEEGPFPSAGSGGASEGGASSRAGSAGWASAGKAGDEADAGSAGDGGGGGEGGAGEDTGGTAGTGGGLGSGGNAGTSTGGGSGPLAVGGYPSIDIGPQQKASKLDVLFVVDNSVSMADKQNILDLSLPSFVRRLANPLCIDGEGHPVATQPASGAVTCTSGTREMASVTDVHFGVITSSLGSHGGSVCAAADGVVLHPDDRGQLLPSQRANLPSYANTGYLAYDATGVSGVSDLSLVLADLQTVVNAVGEHGCGYEAPLEAMYRFLVDPEPPSSIARVGGLVALDGINSALLAQRNAFLRPDSAVAIVILSDESDCSIMDSGVGWFVGSTSAMPRATAACDLDVNDPCCRSCALREITPPAGCSALQDDAICKNVPVGGPYATWDTIHDSLNLRCFDQQRRFGFDLLYPTERYSDALSNPQVRNRAGVLVDNPLFAARDGKGPRSATLVSVSLIVGAPWQDLASAASLSPGYPLRYLDGASLESNSRWPLLLGDPALNLPPLDPFMIESIAERTGKNPLTQTPIVASTSTNPLANPINGHEQNNPMLDDLQFACTFPLPAAKPCPNGDVACDCSAEKSGKLDAVIETNSPLCQPPEGGAVTSTQYYGKGYPSSRQLRFARQLGARALPASICPKTLTDTTSPDYAYRPAFTALVRRLAATLQ